MNREEIKQQILSSLDEVVDIISKDNAAEIKKCKDGIEVFEVTKKKRTKKQQSKEVKGIK